MMSDELETHFKDSKAKLSYGSFLGVCSQARHHDLEDRQAAVVRSCEDVIPPLSFKRAQMLHE
jgi:hypothetical protein